MPTALAAAIILSTPWSDKKIFVTIGKTYKQTAIDSTFKVDSYTAFYPGDPKDESDLPYPSSTWIRTPTIITFDDPTYGFTLPETVFGAISYRDLKVSTITTSPMVVALPFQEAASRLTHLQKTLQERGWSLQPTEHNTWFALESAAQQKELQDRLFDHANSISLYVPNKYSLFLTIKCYSHCTGRNPNTARYLIDISIGRDRHNL